MSSLYDSGKDEEKRSLHDLAETIRRVRLRRQQSLEDSIAVGGIQENGVLKHHDKGWVMGRNIHPPQAQQGGDLLGAIGNDRAEPTDNILPATSEDENNRNEGEVRLEQLEERVRLSQEIRVKEELRAKYLEDKMSESLDALKQYTDNLPPLGPPEIEAESFS